jgi:hypothetical protein
MRCEFFGHLLDPPFEKTKRVVRMLVRKTARLGVDTQPANAQSCVEVQREAPSKCDDLLVGEAEHLGLFDRIGRIFDKFLAKVNRNGQSYLHSQILSGQQKHKLADHSLPLLPDLCEIIGLEGSRQMPRFECRTVEGNHRWLRLLFYVQVGHLFDQRTLSFK